MPFIVNQSFFIGDISLPNLNQAAELNFLNDVIAKREPECLLKILGYPLFKLFGTELTQRMTDLLDGAEYTDGEGNLRKWKGLKYDTNYSLIAYYIYFYHQEKKARLTTGTGTSVQKPEAGTQFSPRWNMANAWNLFSQDCADMRHFLWLKKDNNGDRIYPEFTYHQFLETKRISRFIDPNFSF